MTTETRRLPVARTCERCGWGFTLAASLAARGQGRFCSLACKTLASRKRARETKACERCGASFLTGAHGQPVRYCSQRCALEAQRKPAYVFTCEHCGRGQELTGPAASEARRKRYCSPACARLAASARVDRTCAVCRSAFSVKSSVVAAGHGWYCSRRCTYQAMRRSVDLACLSCGSTFSVRPARARAGRRYCTRACSGRSRVRAQSVACRQCGELRWVTPGLLARGRGVFCSRACWAEWQRGQRPTLQCPVCRKKFRVAPSTARRGRTYCSRRCLRHARRPRRFKCGACGDRFEARAWRKRRYCSLSCANRGRPRPVDPESAGRNARNARILELRAGGLKSPAIARVIAMAIEAGQAPPGWHVDPAAIRQVIARSRSRRAGQAPL